MIPTLRARFNRDYRPEKYSALLASIADRCGMAVEFRVAETPVFMERARLDEMAAAGAEMAYRLIGDAEYMAAARQAIPRPYRVAGQSDHPNFLTADFALVRQPSGALEPRLVEIQAFPSVYGYQETLCSAYRDIYGLGGDLGCDLGCFLGGLDEDGYWELLRETVVGGNDPRSVVLTEIDPEHQKTRPDFAITARRLGIAVVDIAAIEAIGNKLHYKSADGWLVPIRRIYNRAIVDELIARDVKLPFDLTYPWTVEWAGHPNWYFLISKFSIPWLSRPPNAHPAVPPAVFLDEFLAGRGREQLAQAGVPMPAGTGADAVYSELLLKPLFSFAGKGIQFEPTQALLESIPEGERGGYLLQQRMRFEHVIETPHGPTQPEFRILYLWPDRRRLTPALSLVRLGRGKMMGVDHNKNQEWVGASAAFYPLSGNA